MSIPVSTMGADLYALTALRRSIAGNSSAVLRGLGVETPASVNLALEGGHSAKSYTVNVPRYSNNLAEDGAGTGTSTTLAGRQEATFQAGSFSSKLRIPLADFRHVSDMQAQAYVGDDIRTQVTNLVHQAEKATVRGSSVFTNWPTLAPGFTNSQLRAGSFDRQVTTGALHGGVAASTGNADTTLKQGWANQYLNTGGTTTEAKVFQIVQDLQLAGWHSGTAYCSTSFYNEVRAIFKATLTPATPDQVMKYGQIMIIADFPSIRWTVATHLSSVAVTTIDSTPLTGTVQAYFIEDSAVRFYGDNKTGLKLSQAKFNLSETDTAAADVYQMLIEQKGGDTAINHLASMIECISVAKDDITAASNFGDLLVTYIFNARFFIAEPSKCALVVSAV